MKAIIMAGGEGSRLRPLTCDYPKPMLPLMGRPLMEYAVRLLKRHGADQIAATLGYLPDCITDHFGDGSALGVSLRYYIEKTPLGTAGSVRRAASFLDECFYVLSGDGITDLDLSAALRFHRERRAVATLILKKCSRPQEYGMVVAAPDGRIRAFHEKPGKSDIYSDLINTGVYILEPEVLSLIPEDAPWDFGHDLFPDLLRRGLPVYGYTAAGYWCDVGDTAAYLQVHLDALNGRIRLPGLAEGSMVPPGCRIEEPVFISPSARIEPGARIGPGSVIGENCFVGAGAGVKRSLLLPGARIEENAQLRGCIVGRNSRICARAQLFEESVVGTGSAIGRGCVLPPGVKIWPEKSIADGERPRDNIVWGSRCQERFEGGALMLSSPSQAARAVQACAAQMQLGEALIACADSPVAQALFHAAVSGAMAQGLRTLDGGICALPQLRHAQRQLRAGGAFLVQTGSLIPLDENGCVLSEKQQRAILKLLERQDYPRPFSHAAPPVESVGNTRAAYTAFLASTFDADPALAPKIALRASGGMELPAREAMLRAGLQIRTGARPAGNEISLRISDTEAVFGDVHGELSRVQMQLAIAFTALHLSEDELILPNHFTRAIEELHPGARYIAGEDALWMQTLCRHSPLQQLLHTDPVYFALRFLSILTRQGLTLDQWRRRMPAAWRTARRVEIPSGAAGQLLRALAQKSDAAQLGGGLRLQGERGWAWLSPDSPGQMRIFAESASMETSRELCDFYAGEIRRLLNAQD